MSASAEFTRVVKVSLGDVIFRLNLGLPAESEIAFGIIVSAVQNAFQTCESSATCLSFMYADSKGDLCSLSPGTLTDLLALYPTGPLRLHLHLADTPQPADTSMTNAAVVSTHHIATAEELIHSPNPPSKLTAPEDTLATAAREEPLSKSNRLFVCVPVAADVEAETGPEVRSLERAVDSPGMIAGAVLIEPQSFFTQESLQASIIADRRAFLKCLCGQCGRTAGLGPKYKDALAPVLCSMREKYWCRDCGRVLCDSHRYDHTCERVDAEKQARISLPREELRRRMAEAEVAKAATESAKRDGERKRMETFERQKADRKAKRKVLAAKAKLVERFVQQCARDSDAWPRKVHDELLALYPKASRISLALSNEFEHPSSQEVGGEVWEEMKAIYTRSQELLGITILTDEGPLDMTNPWDLS